MANKVHKLRINVEDLPRGCGKAATILEYACASVAALYAAYESSRSGRAKPGTPEAVGPPGKPRGQTTDEEQDLLRAMLVMATAGLDASVKQLVRDTLARLVDADLSVRERLEKFIARSLRSEAAGGATAGEYRFLSQLLAAKRPQATAIGAYIGALTGDSLQSFDELSKAASALGCVPRELHIDKDSLDPVFVARNKIIHEMDMDLSGERRKRVPRRQDDMLTYANRVLEIGENLVLAVADKLAEFEEHLRRRIEIARAMTFAEEAEGGKARRKRRAPARSAGKTS